MRPVDQRRAVLRLFIDRVTIATRSATKAGSKFRPERVLVSWRA